MGKMSQVHSIIVAMLEEHYSCSEIAEDLNVPLSMVQRVEEDRLGLDHDAFLGTLGEVMISLIESLNDLLDSDTPELDHDWDAGTDALDDEINGDWCSGDGEVDYWSWLR